MSLDGLRAWIGEVERKLRMRTRVFLVLAVIAIGGAGAGIYLAVDARDNSVSESDVQALQERLEARIDEGGGATGGGSAQLEAEVRALQERVEQLEGGGTAGPAEGKKEPGGTGDGSSAGGAEGSADKGGASESGGASAAPSGGGGANIEKLLEETQKKNEEAEREQAEE